LLALVVVLGGFALFAWLLPVSTTTQNETFEGGVDQLVIEVVGDVSLVAGDRTQLTITKEWALTGEPTVDVEYAGGVGRVTSYCGVFQFKCVTSVSGTVDAGANIEVVTSAGNVEVSGTTNGVDLTASAGSVTADDVIGSARLRSSAGAIRGTITDGDVDAETSAGLIDLTVLGDFTSISAITSAGSVALTVTDDVYNVQADSSAGSVNTSVRTDPTAAREIIAESSAGSITIRPAG